MFKLNLTYLLTPWCRVLLEKLTGFQLVKKFSAFYGTRMFIIAFTSARLLSLSWASSIQSISPGPRLSVWTFRNMICFNGEELTALRPNPKLEGHPLSAVCDCIFCTFAATLHIGGCSSIHNLRKRHAVMTGTHLSRKIELREYKCEYMNLNDLVQERQGGRLKKKRLTTSRFRE
jgi:hypothetical protein